MTRWSFSMTGFWSCVSWIIVSICRGLTRESFGNAGTSHASSPLAEQRRGVAPERDITPRTRSDQLFVWSMVSPTLDETSPWPAVVATFFEDQRQVSNFCSPCLWPYWQRQERMCWCSDLVWSERVLGVMSLSGATPLRCSARGGGACDVPVLPKLSLVRPRQMDTITHDTHGQNPATLSENYCWEREFFRIMDWTKHSSGRPTWQFLMQHFSDHCLTLDCLLVPVRLV